MQGEEHINQTDLTIVNTVPWIITENTPGIFVTFNSADKVHDAMVNAPLPVGLEIGATPDQSLRHLMRWYVLNFPFNCSVHISHLNGSRIQGR